MNKMNFLLIVALAAIGIIARLIDHTPNFAPITALALVAGYYLPRRSSWIVPLAAMLVSDAMIGFYSWQVMLSVYASFALVWLVATMAASSGNKSSLIPATLVSSVVFFLVTNTAVWGFTDMYVKSAAGLMQSYSMAIPFFKATLLSDIIFTASFVGMMELARAFVTHRAVSGQALRA
jgi:hypothetical protein